MIKHFWLTDWINKASTATSNFHRTPRLRCRIDDPDLGSEISSNGFFSIPPEFFDGENRRRQEPFFAAEILIKALLLCLNSIWKIIKFNTRLELRERLGVLKARKEIEKTKKCQFWALHEHQARPSRCFLCTHYERMLHKTIEKSSTVIKYFD